jgi:hypothetical protein
MDEKSTVSREHDTIAMPTADVSGIGEQEIEVEAQSPSSDMEETERPKLRLYLILVALFLSLFVAALDDTIVATAIPTIAAELHSASSYTWIGG